MLKINKSHSQPACHVLGLFFVGFLLFVMDFFFTTRKMNAESLKRISA